MNHYFVCSDEGSSFFEKTLDKCEKHLHLFLSNSYLLNSKYNEGKNKKKDLNIVQNEN